MRKESEESVISVEKRVKEDGDRLRFNDEEEEKDANNLLALVNKIRPAL